MRYLDISVYFVAQVPLIVYDVLDISVYFVCTFPLLTLPHVHTKLNFPRETDFASRERMTKVCR